MTITAKIIADSEIPNGSRLTTFVLKYPRFIHSELMTHRTFSRNASSSRAIPVETMIKNIQEDTAMPIHWGKNQSGMQADVETSASIVFGDGENNTMQWQTDAKGAWEEARDRAIEVAEAFHKAGYHKQVVNRILEPFMHIEVIVTSTEEGFANFFHLRDHKDAQPEIRELAKQMLREYAQTTPNQLAENEWHLPFVGPREKEEHSSPTLLRLSVARCARVSYLTHEGKVPSVEADLKLYDRLVGSTPLHASPTEHQARRANDADGDLSGNLSSGWTQHRKLLANENITKFDYSEYC